MATVIQIRRSQLATAPTTGALAEGELAFAQDRATNTGGVTTAGALYIKSADALNADLIQKIASAQVVADVEAATSANTADTIVKRDGSGDFAGNVITANSFVGAITGNADTATALETARDIALDGDVTGTASFDGTSNISITSTIAAGAIEEAMFDAAVDAETFALSAGFASNAGTVAIGDTIEEAIEKLDANIASTQDAGYFATEVKFVITTNNTLATGYENGDTADGQVLTTGDRILLNGQTTTSENGIYTVNATGAPTRATDADASADYIANKAIGVTDGASEGSVLFYDGSSNPVIDTGAISFDTLVSGTVPDGAVDETKLASTVDAESFLLSSGYLSAAGTVAIGDTIEEALEKLDGNITNISTSFDIAGDTGTDTVNSTETITFTGGTGITTAVTDNLVTLTNDGVTSITGTANEVEVDVSTGAVTIGLPDNVTVSGNLTVNGTTTTVNSTTVEFGDSTLHFGEGNITADVIDTGAYGSYSPDAGSTVYYHGFFRDASDSGKYKFVDTLTVEPGSTFDLTNASTATIVADIEGDLTGDILGVTADALLVGAGAGAMTELSSATEGHVLQINGSGAPIFGMLDGGSY